MTPPIDPKQAALDNPAVDVRKLEEVQTIRQKMEQAGVAKSAHYRLSPALGTEKLSSNSKPAAFRMSR